MIKVTVLGAWGTEDIGETSSFLVQSDDFSIVLDMCPGVARQLKRIKFQLKDLDIAFGSHVHSDHILGATYLLFQYSVETRGICEDMKKKFTFLGDRDVLKTMDEVIKLHYPDRGFTYKKIECSNGFIYRMENGIKITTAYNNHTVPTMAIRIDWTNGKSICYTSDGLLTPEVYELANGVDLLIGEAFGSMSLYGDKYIKVKHNLGVGLGKLAKECAVKSVLPFHMNPIYEKDEIKKSELFDEIKWGYDGKIIWPYDLREIVI